MERIRYKLLSSKRGKFLNMIDKIGKYHFKCYLCEEITPKKNKGAVLRDSTIPSMKEEICTKCVHKNYCWATDKELKEFTYNIKEDDYNRRIGLFYEI